MEMEKIREQLACLSELIAGWSTPAEASALERDLVLEKLRALYEAVRFPHPEGAAAEAVSAASEAPVSERVEAVVAELPAAVAAFASAEECPARALEAAVTELAAAEPEVAGGAANAVVADVAASESVPESEPEIAACGAEISELAEVPAETAAVAVAAPAESGEAVSPEVDPAAARSDGAAFDPEVLAARRREKRRIIRSLYEADDAEVCRFAAAERTSEAPRTEEPAVLTPEVAAEPVSQAAPLPVSAAEELLAAAPAPETDDISGAAELPAGTPAEIIARDEVAVPASESFDASVAESLPDPEPQAADGQEEQPAVVSEYVPRTEPRERGAVLGEVIGGGPVLGETIPAAASVASEIVRREPIADLRGAIGINDRFLLVRDLFAGDQQACDRAIDSLNGFDDLDDCLVFIAETYDWNPASEGAKLLMELLERKLG